MIYYLWKERFGVENGFGYNNSGDYNGVLDFYWSVVVIVMFKSWRMNVWYYRVICFCCIDLGIVLVFLVCIKW